MDSSNGSAHNDDGGLLQLLEYLTNSGLINDNDPTKLTEFESLVMAEINKVREQPELLSILKTFRWNGNSFHDPWGGKLDLKKLQRKLEDALSGGTALTSPQQIKSRRSKTYRNSQLNDNIMLQSYCPELLFSHCHQVFMPTNVRLPGAVMLVCLKGLSKYASGFCQQTEPENDDIDEKGGFNNINHQAGIDVRTCSTNLNSYFGAIFDIISHHGGDVISFDDSCIVSVFPTSVATDEDAVAEGEDKFSAAVPLEGAMKGDYSSERRHKGLVCVGATSCAWILRESAPKLKKYLGENVSLCIGLGYGDLMLATVGGHRSKWTYLCVAECVQRLHYSLLNAADNDVVLAPAFYDLVCDWFDMNTTTLVHALGSGDRTLYGLSFCVSKPQRSLQAAMASELDTIVSVPTFSAFRGNVRPEPEVVNSRVRSTVARAFVPQPVFEAILTGRYGSWAEFRENAQSMLESTGGYMDRFDVNREGEPVLRALWGVPSYSYGNNALRAVECASSIVANSPVRCIVGITTGVAYCGNLGTNFRRGYFVAGENVALSRHFTAVSGVQVNVCTSTYKLLPQNVKDSMVLNYPMPRVAISYSLKEEVLAQRSQLMREAVDITNKSNNSAALSTGLHNNSHANVSLNATTNSVSRNNVRDSSLHSVLNSSHSVSMGNSFFSPAPELAMGAEILHENVMSQLLQALEKHDQIDRQELLFELEDMEEGQGPQGALLRVKSTKRSKAATLDSQVKMAAQSKGAQSKGGCGKSLARLLGFRASPAQMYAPSEQDSYSGAGERHWHVHGQGVLHPNAGAAYTGSVIDQLKRYSTDGGATLKNVTCMLVEGNGGGGMSGVAAHFIDNARLYCSRCVFLSARAEDSTIPYALVRRLIEALIGVDNFQSEEQQKNVFKKLLQLAFGSLAGYNQSSLLADLETLGVVLGLGWIVGVEDDAQIFVATGGDPTGLVECPQLESVDPPGAPKHPGNSHGALYRLPRVASLLNTMLGMILMQKPSVVLMENAQRWDELSWRQLLLLLDLPVSLVLVLTVRIGNTATVRASQRNLGPLPPKVASAASADEEAVAARDRAIAARSKNAKSGTKPSSSCLAALTARLFNRSRSNKIADLSVSMNNYGSDSEDEQEYGQPLAVKVKGRALNTVVIQYKSTQSVQGCGASVVQSGVLHSAYAALICSRNVTRLSAIPLTKDQIRNYLRRKVAAAPSASQCFASGVDSANQIVDMVYDISHGNQYWCERLVKIILKRGAESLMREIMSDAGVGTQNEGTGADWVDFASTTNMHSKSAHTFTLLSVFGYKHLTSAEQAVLLASSVIGEEFSVPMLFYILPPKLEMDAESLAVSLDTLVAGGFYVCLDSNPLCYAFTSSQVQRILYSLNTRVEASEFHGSVVRYIENEYSNNLAPHYASLSFHLSFCGSDRQSDAFMYDTLVADDALSKGMFGDVTAYVRNASRHARALGEWAALQRLVDASLIEITATLRIGFDVPSDRLRVEQPTPSESRNWFTALFIRDPEGEVDVDAHTDGAGESVHMNYHRYLLHVKNTVEQKIADRLPKNEDHHYGVLRRTTGSLGSTRNVLVSGDGSWILPYVDSLRAQLSVPTLSTTTSTNIP